MTVWLLAANRLKRCAQVWATSTSCRERVIESGTMASSEKGTNAIHDKLHVNYVIDRARTVIYNILQLVRGYVAAGRPEPVKVEEVSTEKIFEDMHEQLVSLHTVLSSEEVVPSLKVPKTLDEMKQRLATRLGNLWSPRWKKSVNKKRRPVQAKAKQSGAHTSVHKLLQQAKQQHKDQPSTHQRQ